MVCKVKNCLLLLTGLLFITCNNNEVKKTTASEVIKAKDTIQVFQAEVIKKEPLVFKVQIAALKQPNETLSKLEDVAIFQENGFINTDWGILIAIPKHENLETGFVTHTEMRLFKL